MTLSIHLRRILGWVAPWNLLQFELWVSRTKRKKKKSDTPPITSKAARTTACWVTAKLFTSNFQEILTATNNNYLFFCKPGHVLHVPQNQESGNKRKEAGDEETASEWITNIAESLKNVCQCFQSAGVPPGVFQEQSGLWAAEKLKAAELYITVKLCKSPDTLNLR